MIGRLRFILFTATIVTDAQVNPSSATVHGTVFARDNSHALCTLNPPSAETVNRKLA